MLDIALVVLGLGIIGVSYVISEKVETVLKGKNQEESAQIKDIWTEKDEKRVRERIDSIVEEKVEQAIDKTEDELCRISNEKIMTSNEFSEQVLGKIEHNHEEVVFLYNMLNEKEKQMKALMQEIETLKTAAEQKVEEEKELISMEQLTGSEEKELSQLREFAKAIEESETEEKTKNVVMEEVKDTLEQQPEQVVQAEMKEKQNRNDEILTLHKQGMSVLEISKTLDMGQGEVKLIIDLFQGANE